MPQNEMFDRDDASSASRAALARAQEAAARIPDDALVAVRVDITDAALGVMGQMPTIEAYRGDIVAIFAAEGTDALDAVVPAARSAMLANATFVAQGTRDVEPAADSLRKTRTRLSTLANAIVERGVVERGGLADLEGGNAYVSLVHDTLLIVAWFQANEAAIAPYSRVTSAELDAAQLEATAFGTAVKEKARTAGGEAASARLRAFTHFVRSYEHVRKLVTYVRWDQEDAAVIAPSIYAGRTRSKDESEPAVLEPTVLEPTVLAPASPNPVSPGLPGEDPFIRQ